MSGERKSPKSLDAAQAERVLAVLRVLHEEKRLTQTKIGKLIGVSQQYVSSVLRGRSIGAAAARNVAQYLGITYDELTLGRAQHRRRYVDVDGWHEAAAKLTDDVVPSYAIEAAGLLPVSIEPETPVPPTFVAHVALFWLRWAHPEIRDAAERRAIASRALPKKRRRRRQVQSAHAPRLLPPRGGTGEDGET